MAHAPDEPGRDQGRKVPPREILKLILATYAASLPYLLLFVVAMLLVIWAVATFLR